MGKIIDSEERFLGVKLRGRPQTDREIAREIVWLCSCGGQEFFMCCNGEVQCVACGAYQLDLYCYEPDDSGPT